MTELAVIAGLSMIAALALGIPLRVFGWRATWDGFRAGLRWMRRHRWTAFWLLLIGALAGLWTFEDARRAIFNLFFGLF